MTITSTLKAIYGENFLDVFKKDFSELNIQEGLDKVISDAKSKGIEIREFSSAALYSPLKALGFSFKLRPKGRQADPNAPPKPPKIQREAEQRGRKDSPVYDKFLTDLGGLEDAKKYLSELVLEGISLKEAVDRINTKTSETFSYGNISYFAEKLCMEFAKGRKGNPNLGKNRPSPILDSFLSNFKDEDEAKTYLQSLTHLSLNEALEEINKKIENEISYSNLISFAKKWNFEFKRLIAKKGEGKNQKPISGEVEMETEAIEVKQKTPIKVHYKCKECNEARGMQKLSLEIPLGLRGMRCHHCGEWGTYIATVITETETRRFTIINEEGLTPNVKIPIETEVDINLQPIQIETIVEPELQTV